MRFKKYRNCRMRAAGLAMALCLMTSGVSLGAVTIPPDGSGSVQAQTGGSSSRLPALTAEFSTEEGSNEYLNGQGTAQNTQEAGQTAVPQIKSDAAVLYDATHDRVLYEKNADAQHYPASITKLMTALLVLEHCSLSDTVTFSQSAVTNLESGAVILGVKAGDQFTVEQCLYGLLLKSANEIANGLAEHVSGSVSSFADLMNQKAASLGCTGTHFVNPNGLNDPNHYTTARDMALIAEAAFENPTLCRIASTVNYDFPATASVPSVRKLTMGHKMVNPNNKEYYYEGIVGGKTGYTSLAGNTLVTCVERNGTRLIAVILKSRQTHYADTKALLDYGFSLSQAGETGTSGIQTGGTSGPGGSGSTSGPAGTSGHCRWVQDASGWRFVKTDGSYAAGECLKINGEIYCFKQDTYMVSSGWYQIDGIWYYFRPSGGLATSRWVETNGMWYYVDENGALFTGGTTPDGYRVDENGVWIR